MARLRPQAGFRPWQFSSFGLGRLGGGGGRGITFSSLVAQSTVAWSTGRKINPAFAGNYADKSGGAFTTIYDQVGSRNATGVASPAVGTGAINGLDYCKLNGTDMRYSFTSLALGSGDWEVWLAVGLPGALNSIAMLGLGRSGGTTSLRPSSTVALDIRSDSAGPQAYSLVYPPIPGINIFRVKRTGGSLYIDLNGEQMGSPYGRSIAGNFTFDQIGRSSTTVWSAQGFCECVIFTRTLTDAEANVMLANMSAAWRNGLYVDATGGSDSNLGWNAETAYQNVSAVNTLVLRRGAKIKFKYGEKWTSPLVFNTTNQLGTVADPIVVSAYGDSGLAKPTFSGGTAVAGSGMTLDSGTEYSVAVALTNVQGVWAEAAALPADLNGKKVLRLVSGTAGSLTYTPASGTPGAPGYQPAIAQWAYTGGRLRVNVGGSPALYTFQAAQELGSQTSGVRVEKNYFDIYDLLSQYWAYDAFSQGVGQTGSRLFNCQGEYSANDCFGGGGNACSQTDCVAAYPGQGRTTSGPTGDCYSAHGGATLTRLRCTALGGDKAGFDDQDSVTSVNTNCYARGCNQNIFSASNGGGGLQTWNNLIVIRESYDQANAVNCGAGSNHTFSFPTVFNNDSAGSSVALRCSTTGTVNVQNLATKGFGTDLLLAAGTLNHDHCCLPDLVPYSGTSAGVGDITSDPLFTNTATLDLTLQEGSPCLGAGVAVAGVTTDYAGAARANPPSIGAYES